MFRLRCAVAAVCLAVVLFAALPGALSAQRDAEQASAIALSEPLGERLVGSVLAWGRGALAWLQAIIAGEHGQIAQTPVVPPSP